MSFQYFPLSLDERKKRSIVWDSLLARRPFGGVAVNLITIPDYEDCKKAVIPPDQIPLADVSCERIPLWDSFIREQIHRGLVFAASRYQCDSYPALDVPRSVFGQTQALAEIFGSQLIPVPAQSDLYHPIPCIEEGGDVDRIKIKPLDQCLYGNAVRFVRYAYESTEGQLSIKNPVMTGPIDTANYILGSMKLMEWIFDEPEALHRLLRIITEQLIALIKCLYDAAGGKICPDLSWCLPKCYSLCSEVRHMLSSEAYAEFEAPYLRQIGKECGPYAYHSCGTFERVLETDMQDPNLILANFQTKEMDLGKVYDVTKGNLSLFVGRSINLHERFLWPDEKSFFTHLFTAFPGPVPVETNVFDAEQFLIAYRETDGGTLGSYCGIRTGY